MKQIVGTLLMIIQTILGIVICLGIALVINMNSEAVLKSSYKANYLNLTEQAAEDVLKGYMIESKAKEILKEISIKSGIKELIFAIDNNTVEKKAEIMKQEINTKVIESLEDNVDDSLKEQYANRVSNAYMKTIFPIKEMSILSKVYTLYKSKIVLAIIILTMLYGIIYVYLSKGRKTYKWQIISMYNVIVFTTIIFILIGLVANITIGNERTASVIMNMINKIRFDLLYTLLIMAILTILSNYFAYFRKKKKKAR